MLNSILSSQGAKLLAVALCIVGTTQWSGWAQSIGVVDTEIIGRDYKKAQTLSQQVRTKEEELQKYRAELAKELKDKGEKATPVEKKALEERLNKQFAEKLKGYRDWLIVQEEQLRTSVEKAIKEVAESEKMDMILTKTVVLQGGKDVTDKVVGKLNQ